MDAMASLWKNILIWATVPIFSHIKVPVYTCSSGVLENNMDAIYEMRGNPMLQKLIVWGMFIFVFATYLTLFIIKMTNAMQKVMLSLLKIFIMWIFFMIWQGAGH
jgi:hypothetical protein